MLRKFVSVINAGDTPITIRDRRFSGGKLVLAPGEEYELANDVWMDHRRRYKDSLKDATLLSAEELERLRGLYRGEEKPAKAVESPEEPEPAEEESAADTENSEDEPAKELKMPELRARAKELGITLPVGITKKEAAKLVAAGEVQTNEAD